MLKVEVDIGLCPATITCITKVNMVYCSLYQEIMLVGMGELDINPRPYTLHPEEEIVSVKVQVMEVGLKISTIIICSMLYKVLMELVEVDIGLVPALIHPIIQLIMIYHLYL